MVRALLSKGADVSAVGERSYTALLVAAELGHLQVTKDLAEAGADLEAKTNQGATPISLAADQGHAGVIRALMEAGANPDNPRHDGATPMFFAAWKGHVGAIRELLRGTSSAGGVCVPLEAASQHGHAAVAVELIRQLGIKGCGGASGGVEALGQAAQNNHAHVLAVLTEAGVVDTGRALTGAAIYSREAAVKFLLREQERSGKYAGGGGAYADAPDTAGRTPLVCCLVACRPSSRRIVRLLIDAGADETSAVRNPRGALGCAGGDIARGTPLAFVSYLLHEKKVRGKPATEEELHSLEGIRRVLLRVDAARAVSFSWPSDEPRVGRAAESASRANVAAAGAAVAAEATTPTPLALALPILRRRTVRRGVLVRAMLR